MIYYLWTFEFKTLWASSFSCASFLNFLKVFAYLRLDTKVYVNNWAGYLPQLLTPRFLGYKNNFPRFIILELPFVYFPTLIRAEGLDRNCFLSKIYEFWPKFKKSSDKVKERGRERDSRVEKFIVTPMTFWSVDSHLVRFPFLFQVRWGRRGCLGIGRRKSVGNSRKSVRMSSRSQL